LYTNLRGLLTFGVRKAPLRNALKLEKGEKILDLACGTGDYSPIISSPDNSYLGLDINDKYIHSAIKKHSAPNREFNVQDILELEFKENEFDKSLYIGIMHHLNDEDNLTILKTLKQITNKNVFVLDWSPGGINIFTNLFSKLDRGKYIRNLNEQVELISRVMKVVDSRNYYVRSGILRYSLISCKP
jgi:ubiquinone/menaquinone biosynthesis C-methylase UbiE